jgi:hypothetical protein
MAIVVPTPEAVASKWSSRTAAATGDYTAGVKAPKRDWQSNTEKAAANYQAAVQAGNIGAKFTYGVKRVGTAKWQANAVNLGSQRFAAGVQNAAPAMSTGIAPYLSVISGLTLPERQPRGNPANYQRSAAVGTALNAKRVSLMGAGI